MTKYHFCGIFYFMSEPSPESGPVRERIGGGKAKHGSLSEIRPKITAIDEAIVDLRAERALLVLDAGFFKRDAGENAAPQQQQTNIDNSAHSAERYDARIPGFSSVVRKAMEVEVPAFVDLQRQEIERTFLVDEGHRMEPEIWDLGDIPNYRRDIIARWECKVA